MTQYLHEDDWLCPLFLLSASLIDKFLQETVEINYNAEQALLYKILMYSNVSEWVSDCCLMPNGPFSAISWQEQVMSDEMIMISVLN